MTQRSKQFLFASWQRKIVNVVCNANLEKILHILSCHRVDPCSYHLCKNRPSMGMETQRFYPAVRLGSADSCPKVTLLTPDRETWIISSLPYTRPQKRNTDEPGNFNHVLRCGKMTVTIYSWLRFHGQAFQPHPTLAKSYFKASVYQFPFITEY